MATPTNNQPNPSSNPHEGSNQPNTGPDFTPQELMEYTARLRWVLNDAMQEYVRNRANGDVRQYVNTRYPDLTGKAKDDKLRACAQNMLVAMDIGNLISDPAGMLRLAAYLMENSK